MPTLALPRRDLAMNVLRSALLGNLPRTDLVQRFRHGRRNARGTVIAGAAMTSLHGRSCNDLSLRDLAPFKESLQAW
jgi:hypothetical protein